MADLAEILMVEHLAIRHIKKSLTKSMDFDPFLMFCTYLKDCHIQLEEKVLFPLLTGHEWTDSREFTTMANQIKADHKLLDTLANNLVKWHRSEDIELFTERFPLFFRLLTEHNEREEIVVFPRWKLLSQEEVKGTLSDARSIVESYGKDNYLTMIGLTDEAYRYLIKIQG